jgi:dihydrofolate reductase
VANFVYIATSLDGYIAAIDGGLNWLYEIPNPNNDDYGYTEFLSGIDAIVMGRGTYEKVLSFEQWPYEKPAFVLSRTLTSVPDALADKVEFIKGDLKPLVRELNARGYQNLYIDGGKTIQSFLAEDLIDVMIIARIPVLLGNGIPLFGKMTHDIKFSHQKTDIYGDIVKSFYTRVRP